MKPDLQSWRSNATFIAHARQDIPDLLDYIEKLEAVVKCIKVYKEKCVTVECTPKHCYKCNLSCNPECEDHNQCGNCAMECLDDALAGLDGDGHET